MAQRNNKNDIKQKMDALLVHYSLSHLKKIIIIRTRDKYGIDNVLISYSVSGHFMILAGFGAALKNLKEAAILQVRNNITG